MKASWFEIYIGLNVQLFLERPGGVDRSCDLDPTRFWNFRLGHVAERSLDLVYRRRMIKGESCNKLDLCQECVVGKQTKVSFGVGKHSF